MLPKYIQQIFVCADHGPGVGVVFHRNKNRTKRDISPDIKRIQFREGVREVNKVTAYYLNN